MRFQKEKFWFDHSDPQRFTQSRWTQNDKVGRAYLSYKLFVATFWIFVIVLDLWNNSNKTSNVREGAKYLLFATRWGALMITFTFIYDAFLVAFRFAEERKLEKKMIKTQPYFNQSSPTIKFGWFLSACSYSSAFFISVVYWIFLYDYTNGVDGVAAISVFLNLAEHLFQSINAIIDIWISSRPCRVQHFWCPLLFGLVYMIFNVVYILAFDGTDNKGRDYIYPILKWHESPGLSVAFVAGAAVAIVLFHGVHFGLTVFRDKIWSKKYFDPENELLDGAPKSMASEKLTGIRTLSFKTT